MLDEVEIDEDVETLDDVDTDDDVEALDDDVDAELDVETLHNITGNSNFIENLCKVKTDFIYTE